MSGYDDSSYGDSSYDDSSYGDSRYDDSSYGDSSYDDSSYGDSGYDDSDTTTLLRRLQLRRLRSSHDDSSYGLSYPGYGLDHDRASWGGTGTHGWTYDPSA